MASLSPKSAAAIARLRSYIPPPSTAWYQLPLSRRAAVLILLYADRKGDLRVVLTMRSSMLKSYAGQAALPGGKADALSESPVECARREAYEEIGLPMPRIAGRPAAAPVDNNHAASPASIAAETKWSPETPGLPYPFKIEHLCQIPTNLAKTELGVRPCVAFLYATSPVDRQNNPVDAESTLIPRLDAKEVAAVFSAPFHNFLLKRDELPEARKVEGSWYKGSWTDWHETKFRMHNFYVPVKGQVVTRPQKEAPAAEAATAALQLASTQPGAAASSSSSGGSTDNNDASSSLSEPLRPRTRSQTAAASKLPYRDHPQPYSASNPDPLDSLARFRVFGMTARILVDCARVAYGQEPQFEHNSHFGDEAIIDRLIKIGRLDSERGKGDEFVGNDVRKLLSYSSPSSKQQANPTTSTSGSSTGSGHLGQEKL